MGQSVKQKKNGPKEKCTKKKKIHSSNVRLTKILIASPQAI